MQDIESPIEVKISGDGAPFTRLSSYIIMSFSLPTLQKSLSSSGKYMYMHVRPLMS